MAKTPHGLFVLWLIFFGIVGNIIIMGYRLVREHNTPPLHKRFVERDAFEKFEQETNEQFVKIENQFKENAKAGSESREKLWNEVKELRKEMHEQANDTNDRIDRVPERVIQILNLRNNQ